MAAKQYPCVAASVESFLAQLIRYISSGHYFYITGKIPEHKDAEAVDGKLLALYDADRPKWKRQRRRLLGQAGIHYLRYGRFWVIVLTKGEHSAFYRDHGSHVLDIRRTALKFAGYSVRYSYSELEKRYRVFVRLDKRTYRQLREECLEFAVWPSMATRDRLEEEIARRMQRFQPYGPVREQFAWILRAVNRRRSQAGYAQISMSIVPQHRRLVAVYSPG